MPGHSGYAGCDGIVLAHRWLGSRRRRRNERAVAAVGRPVHLWQVWLVWPKASVDRGLAPAIGKNDGEIRNDDCPDQRYRGGPAQVIDEQQDGREEADRPDGHHDQVTALPVADVFGQAAARLGDNLRLVALTPL